MKITDDRARDLLRWLDDMAGDHVLLFDEMARYRDAAALIRQLQAEVQDAWHAGLDAGREQGKDHAHQPPSVPVGVEGLVEKWRLEDIHDGERTSFRSASMCADELERALAQQPAAVEGEEGT